MVKKRSWMTKEEQAVATKYSYIDTRFIIKAYNHLKTAYKMPTLDVFTAAILSLRLSSEGIKFRPLKDGFEFSIPITHVIKKLKLRPRI